jgi:hypothetical protein
MPSVATLNDAGCDLHDPAKLVRLAGRIKASQLLGQIQISMKAAYREQEERQRARREATSRTKLHAPGNRQNFG